MNPLLFLPLLKFTVKEESMLPTLKPGDTVLVWRFGSPKVGDIVVLNGSLLIKRVKEIKDGRYFVVGDNPTKSTDSRQFGWVDRSRIIGKVFSREKERVDRG